MNIIDIIKIIDHVNWRFAKSMPNIPHEYIVADQYPEISDEISEFIAGIKHQGYPKLFYGKEYKYIELNGYKYWVIDNIINRAKL